MRGHSPSLGLHSGRGHEGGAPTGQSGMEEAGVTPLPQEILPVLRAWVWVSRAREAGSRGAGCGAAEVRLGTEARQVDSQTPRAGQTLGI